MAFGDAYVFPSFLTPVLTQLFFPKPPTTFLTYFCRGERWEAKIRRKEKSPQPGLNSQPPGHESDTLTTEPPRRGPCFPGVGLTNTSHNIISKALAAFPHNHCRNNGQQWERNESCCNDYHQSSERMVAEPGIEPATSCVDEKGLLANQVRDKWIIEIQGPGRIRT